MPKKSDKKERLLDAARELFHSHGVANTTLSDISDSSGVPLGNVYYYFKTKQELVLAVIAQIRAEYENYFELWDKEEPRVGIRCYIEQYELLADSIANYGCADTGLSLELNKESSKLSEEANTLLAQQLNWVAAKIGELGKQNARKLALHIICCLQGSSVLAVTLKDKNVLLDEIERLKGLVNKIK